MTPARPIHTRLCAADPRASDAPGSILPSRLPSRLLGPPLGPLLGLLGLLLSSAPLPCQALTAEQQKFLDDTFTRFDRSGDGKIVRTEFPGSDAQFQEIDADGNGQVTRAEFVASANARRLLVSHEASQKEPRARAGFDTLAARRWRTVLRFDKNRDGCVARAEWAGTEPAFRSLDLDGNGVLDARDRKLAEAEARPEGYPLRAFTKPLPDKDALIAKHDRNKDGTLSAAELGGTDIAPIFALVDSNGDGQLDGPELQRLTDAVASMLYRRNAGTRADVPRMPEIPFATWDKDKDGRLANAEFENRNLFVLLDADRDGYVTKEEIERYRRNLEGADFISRFDLNDDGRVTPIEFGGALEVFRRADRNGDGVVTKQDG